MGWLFKTTRFTALAHRRTVIKRRQREQEAQMQSELQSATPDPAWEQMSPLLDEALTKLGEKDRQAVLLRYFEERSLKEVGSTLGTGEDGARKRVSRALERLRRFFSRRGVLVTSAAIGGALTANAVHAAPAELAISIGTTAVQGSAAAASTLTLAKGAMKLMTWAKIKTAAWVGTAAVVVTTATTVVVNQVVAQNGSASVLAPNSAAVPANAPALTPNPVALAANPLPEVASPPPMASNQVAIAADPTGIDDSIWEGPVNLAALPPVIIVRPTHFSAPSSPYAGGSSSRGSSRGDVTTTVGYGRSADAYFSGRYMMIAKAVLLANLISAAYGAQGQGQTAGAGFGSITNRVSGGGIQSQPPLDERSLVLPLDSLSNRYDVLMTATNGSVALLAQAIKDQLGYTAQQEDVETNVLLLTMIQPGAPGLKTLWSNSSNAAASRGIVFPGVSGASGTSGAYGVMTSYHSTNRLFYRGANGQIRTNTSIVENQHPGYYYPDRRLIS
jgi:hypothetical protein